MDSQEIIARFWSAGRERDLRQTELDRFLAAGVPPLALVRPDFLLPAAVAFDVPGRFLFRDEMREPGELSGAFLILCRGEDSIPVDLAAWQPSTGMIATWIGTAWCLGEDELGWPRRREDGLPIYTDPLDWLRNSRDGLVILDAVMARRRLSEDGPIIASSVAHGRELRRALTPRAPTILISQQSEKAAA